MNASSPSWDIVIANGYSSDKNDLGWTLKLTLRNLLHNPLIRAPRCVRGKAERFLRASWRRQYNTLQILTGQKESLEMMHVTFGLGGPYPDIQRQTPSAAANALLHLDRGT